MSLKSSENAKKLINSFVKEEKSCVLEVLIDRNQKINPTQYFKKVG